MRIKKLWLIPFFLCKKFSVDFEAFNFQWIFLSFIMHFSISVLLNCTDLFFFFSEQFQSNCPISHGASILDILSIGLSFCSEIEIEIDSQMVCIPLILMCVHSIVTLGSWKWVSISSQIILYLIVTICIISLMMKSYYSCKYLEFLKVFHNIKLNKSHVNILLYMQKFSWMSD